MKKLSNIDSLVSLFGFFKENENFEISSGVYDEYKIAEVSSCQPFKLSDYRAVHIHYHFLNSLELGNKNKIHNITATIMNPCNVRQCFETKYFFLFLVIVRT